MGYGNVSLVYARWGHLPDRPHRLLGYMALRSRDEDDPPRFYEGREACALALGKMTPPEPAAGDKTPRAVEIRKMRRNDFEAVAVAIRVLIREGAITQAVAPGPGRNAVYDLNIGLATGKGYPGERDRVTPASVQGYPGQQVRVTPASTEVPPTGVPHENTTETTNSASAEDSPAADQLDFEKANSILMKMPDLGAQYISRVEHVEGYQARQIAAAALYLAERRDAS